MSDCSRLVRQTQKVFPPPESSKILHCLLSYPKEFYREVRASRSGLSARITYSPEDLGHI